jgi:hypothetical protein
MPDYPKVKLNKYHYFLILFSPFVFLLSSLSRKSVDIKFKAAFVFCVFFGVYFITSSPELDSYRHLENFKTYQVDGFKKLTNHLKDVVAQKVDPELYVPLVNYVLSRFTSSGSVLFGFHAFFYAFFYISSLRLIYEKAQFSRNNLTLGIFLMLIFVAPIHQINAVRWFTAMWCFVYCALRYFNGEKRFLIYAFGSGLIHFSLFLAPLFLMLSLIIGYRPKILLAIAIISFAVPNLQPSELINSEENLGIESVDARVESYNAEGRIENIAASAKQLNWYVRFRYQAIIYFLSLLVVVYLLSHFKSIRSLFLQKLFTFLFLWGSLTNYLMDVPSVGGRMRFLFWILLLAFFYIELTSKKIRFEKPLGYIALASIFLYAIVDFRAYSDWVSAQIFSTPIPLLFTDVLELTVSDVVFFWE